MILKKFLSLAQNIEKLWSQQNNNSNSFSEIALTELANFSIDCEVNQFDQEISEWLLRSIIPNQLNVYNSFSQPPITVFNNGQFVVDIYHWSDDDTSIHSHSFQGAFKVLFGRSIHETFSVKEKKMFAQDVMISDFSKLPSKLLRPGDTKEITRGIQFSHRLIHLDNPTITVCCRTINDQNFSQWNHLPNGLSIQKKALDQKILKQIFYLQYLWNKDQDLGLTFLGRILENSDISQILNLYESLSFDQMGLSEDLVELIFESVNDQYEESEWFKIYHQFYEDFSNNYISVNEDGPEFKFLAHALNTNYTLVEAKEMLLEMTEGKLSELLSAEINLHSWP
jgi:hypothetical protein